MKKSTYCLKGLCIAVILFLSSLSLSAQTTVLNHDFDSNANGWTSSSGWINDASSFTGNTTGHWHTTPFNDYNSNMDVYVTSGTLDLSNFETMTLSFSLRYNTETGWDGMNVEYNIGGAGWNVLGAVGDGTNWYNDADVDAIANNADGWSGDNSNWITSSISLPAAFDDESNVQFRFFFSSDGSSQDDGVAFDDFMIEGTSLCTAPTASYTVVPNCATNFTIDVNITNLGDGTAVDITDGGITGGLTNQTTGVHSMGPYTPGTDVVITVDGSPYGGCAAANSATLTEACACTTTPTATVNAVNLDCGGNTYDVEVTVNSDGDGDANMSDVYIDGVLEEANVTTGALNTYTVATGAHTITIQAEGAGFANCISIDYNTNLSCNNDECADAFTVLTDGTPTTSLDVTTYTSSGNNLSCDSGSSNEDAYYRFVAPTSGMVSIFVDDTNLSGTSTNDVEGAVYASCADATSNTEIACFNSSDSLADSGGQVVTGLTAGNTYYLEVEHFNDNWTGTYDVVIQDLTTTLTLGTKECSTTFTYPSIIDELCTSSCSWLADSDGDAIFTYTPTANQTIDIILSDISLPASSPEQIGFVFTDDPTGATSTCLAEACHNSASSADLSVTGVSVTAGTTYFLIAHLDGFDSTPEETFCVTISSPCTGTSETTSTPASDCTAATYTGRINFSTLGGAATYDLEDDDGNSFTGISASTDYDFSYTDLMNHTVTLKGYDGSSNLVCVQNYSFTSGCNGSDSFSLTAPNILGTCMPGDLSSATVGATGFTPFCDDGGVASGDISNNFMRACPAGFGNNTDYNDIWYQVDLPDGTDEMTLTVTGLGASEILGYVIHTGDPGSDAGANVASVDGDFECSFFDNLVTSHTITGLADESTAPIYIRVLGMAFDDSDCSTIAAPSFTICASAPQANDVCNDGLNINSFDDDVINDPDSFLPVTQSGDISQANTDAETHDDVNGETCNGIAFNTSEEDLWYAIRTPDDGNNYYLDLDIDFTGTADEIYVLLHNFCSNGDTDPIGCESISADGTVSFDASNITNFDNALTPDNDYNIRIVLPTGSTATSFDISATLIAENNTCDVMQNVFPGFDADPSGGGFAEFNMNFASDSGSVPVTAGRDLWFQFDPLTATDSFGFTTASTTAEIVIGGLDAGEEVTLLLYKGQGVSANNCNDLAGDYLETLVVTGNGTVELSCLDELHTSVSGGYLLRIVQTAGGTIIDTGTVNVDPQPAGPYNNDCENIWSSGGPTNLGWTDPTPGPSDGVNDGGLSVNFNPYVIEEGSVNYLTGTFENATDCHPNITSAVCNSIDTQALAANEDRDAWYIMTVPARAGACDLLVSDTIKSVTFTYQAPQAGYLFLYDDCADANLIECSGELASGGSSWTVSGLTQGDSYLVRVKPKDGGAVNNEFSFDISWEAADPVPCNDDVSDAEDLGSSYISGSNYASGCTNGNANGATNNSGVNTGSNTNNVWFEFTAENNADEAGYVNIYLESLSNGGSGNPFTLTFNVYEEVGGSGGISQVNTSSATTNTDGDGWLALGHLVPGEDYFIEILHSQLSGVDVLYNLCLYDVPTNTVACTSDAVSISPVGGGQCPSPYAQDCALYYRVDVPAGTPSGYYNFEVIGDGSGVDIQLFNQGPNAPSAEGSSTDYDQPCASLSGATSGLVSGTTPVAIPATGPGVCNNGSGESRVYNLIGSSTAESLYYYLEVRSTGSFPCDFTAADICSIEVSGPFTTEALAVANTTAPDGSCAVVSCTDPVITTQPAASQSVCNNATPTNLSVTATGTSLSYQWYSNTVDSNAGGTMIATATMPTYTPPTDTVGTVYYYVEVTEATNGPCSVASTTSAVIVNGLPTSPTASVTVQPTCTTPTGTIVVTAPALGANEEYVVTGTSPVVAAQSNTTGTFTSLAPGDYDVTVTNTVTGCTSAATALTVNAVPSVPTTPTASVTVQPTCTTPTGTIVITAPALGANEEYVVTGTSPVVAAQSNTTGTFASLAPGDYDVTVTNTVTGCTSTATALTVNAVPAVPATPTASVTTQPGCGTTTGTITVTAPVLGANEVYEVTGTSPVVAAQTNTSGTFTGLAEGDYDVTVLNTVTLCESSAVSLTVSSSGGSSGSGTSYYVNDGTLADDVFTTAIGNDANAGTAAAPFATLAAAITASSAGDTIYVDSGNYLQHGHTVSHALTIIGAGPGLTQFHGSSIADGANKFMDVNANNVVIRNIMCRWFAENDDEARCFELNGFTGFELDNVIVFSNRGSTNDLSPALKMQNSACATVRNSTFICNGYEGNFGSAISVDTNSILLVEDSIFYRNENSSSGSNTTIGGAIEMHSGTVTINNTTFDENSAWNGGAIGQTGGTLTVNDSCFNNNFSREPNNDQGGGAYYATGGTATFTNCVFTNNKTTNIGLLQAGNSCDGGAILIKGTASLTMNTCSFVDNESSDKAQDIAAIQSSTLVLNDCSLDTDHGHTTPINHSSTDEQNLLVESTATLTNTSVFEITNTGTLTGDGNGTPTATPTASCVNVSSLLTCDDIPAAVCATDTDPPVITQCAVDVVDTVCVGNLADYTGDVSAFDVCGGVTITQSPAAGTSLASLGNGVHTITMTATDDSLNSTTCTFTLTLSNCSVVCVDPVITAQPAASQSVCHNATPTDLSVTATGTSLSYQWYSNTIDSNTGGTMIPTATMSTYTPPTDTVGTVYYYVEVTEATNGPCTVTSTTSAVVVNSIPTTPTASVTVQPTCTTPTGTIVVTAPALGANEEYVVTGTSPVVAAQSNTTGTFASLAPGDYDVTVTNTVTGCTSAATALTVNAVPSNPATPTASVTVQPTCTTPTGTIVVTAPALGVNEEYVVTGTSPVVAAQSNTTGTFASLTPGDYDVTVTNTVTGCTSAATALTVNAVPGAPTTPTASVTVQPTCTTPTGTIVVTAPALGANEEYVVTGTAPVVAAQSNTTGTFASLAPGDYDVTVTNTLTGCTSAATALTVNAVPSNPATPTASVTVQPTCTTPTGTIVVTAPALGTNEEYVVTGTSPVVAAQSNTTGTFASLAPGDYDVTVTNTVTGCTSAAIALTVNAVPGAPTTPTASVTVQPTCTTPTGTIVVTAPALGANEEYVVTGTSPVVAAQSNTTGTFASLAPGDYDVTVTNTVTGCTSAATALTVNTVPGTPTTPTASVTVQPTCTTPTGTIVVTAPTLGANEEYVVTGTSPVVAAQSNTTGTFTSLAPGDYDVTVTNTVTGCTSAATALTVNAVPGAPTTPTASITVQPTCTTPTGTIVVTAPALGANEEYVVTGTTPVVAAQSNTTGTFASLAPGDYDVTVTNTVTGCTSAATALTVNAVPGAPTTPTASVTVQPTCTTPTGTIVVTAPALGANEEYVVTGTAPVVAAQSNTTGTFASLAPGDYDVTVTNTVTGCTSAATALTVNAVPSVPATPTASVTVQPTCTTPTGTIVVTAPALGANEEYVVTGTAPVVAAQSNTTGTFASLAPGDYDVTVTNTVTGCTSAATALTVNAVPSVPATPTASVTVQPTCTTPTGTIVVTAPALGANEEYVVTGTAPIVAAQSNTTGTFASLAPGDYDVTVTNTLTGCTSTATALTVNAVPGTPTTPTASVTVQPTCTTPTGTIVVTAPALGANEEYVVTGTAPVVAAQSNTTGTFASLAPGDYDVTVTNTLTGCTSAAIALTVNAVPGAPTTPTASVTVQPTCTTPTGTIVVTAPALGANEEYVVTGTSPVVAAQSNTTGTFASLAPGDYDVTVTNTVTGCTSTATALTVNAVPSVPATPTATVTAQPDCTTATGTITTTAPALGANEEYVVTGTSPVVAAQSNTTGIFTGLAAGDYDVTVTNTVTGCTSAATALTVNAQPSTPTAPTATVTTQPDCTTATGTITATAPALGANEEYVVTGTSPVVAVQSNTTGVFIGLAAGDYDITVTNTVTGCTSTATALTVNNIDALDCDGDGVVNGSDPAPNDPCDPTQAIGYTGYDGTNAIWQAGDCDGDGVTNGDEDGNTDPYDPCDYDIIDQVLANTTTVWRDADCDGDGVTNSDETLGGTNPNDPCDFNAADITLAQSGDWLTADCDGDGVTNGTEVTDMTDETDPCDFVAGSITLPVTAVTDCDGDGETSATDPDDADPCEGGTLSGVDLTDTTSDWYTADCDGDGVTNGDEVDPDMDGTSGPNNTDPNDPCDFNAADVTVAQSGDWLTADCDGDGVTNGTEVTDTTDETDPCDFVAGSITLPVTAVTDCDGDGETSATDPDDADPCEGGTLANVDLSDTTSDWYAADCDGDGVINGDEVDPDGNGTNDVNGTDPTDPCDFNAADVTVAQSGDWLAADCDGDGVTNGTEVTDTTDETDPCDFLAGSITLPVTAVTDCDGDGETSATDPDDMDSCEGGTLSGVDLTDTTSDWYTTDCDGDGVTNGNEVDPDMDGTSGPNNTDPNDPCDFNAADVTITQSGDWLTADCDGDGVTNGTEVTDTTDETDPCDFLAGSITLPVTAVTDCDGDGETSDTDPDDVDPCEGGSLANVDLTDTTSDWYTADCDGDGVTNGNEVDPDMDGTSGPNNTDPNDPCDFNAADVTIAQSGDWLAADCDGDGVTNGTEVTDMTDETDPCDFVAGSITLPVTAITDCDGDGETSDTDPNDADPCDGGTLSGVDLTDTTSDWYTADCDGDGVTNGDEVDPDGNGANDANGTDPNDPCDFNAADVTIAQSGDWLTADCDGDGVTNGTEVTDTTDETDPCDFLAGSITLPVTAVTDCDGDGETSDTDPDDADPCEGGTLSGVDLTDTTSDWYTTDCDGDGVTNGNEVDPDMDGTSGPNNTNPNDPCDFNPADVTVAQSGDWLTADCDGDGVTNGTEVTDMTDETDPCDFLSGSITLPVTAVTDCDGDGETSATDSNDADPCEGGSLANVDLSDTTSDWYIADCDGDGVINGDEVDPDGNGANDANGTDPNDPCDFNAADVTIAQSGDWLTADCDGDGVTNGTEVTDTTDETDPCDFLAGSITLPVTAVTDCDGDGETSATDPDDSDPCEGGSLANVDLSDTTSDWYTADCDGDGVTNGNEVDPDGNGTNDANGTDPNDPCDFNAADVTIAQSGDWLAADCDGDGVTNGTEVTDMTDETDPCDFVAGSITLPVTAVTDCDGDGETSATDPDDADPCEGGTLSGVDLSDTTSDWYTADCDGDGVINGDEVDPDGNGTNDANGTDPTDPCDFNAVDVTVAQSGDWLTADCDGDGVANGTEVTDTTDETDPCDFLAGSITLPVTAVTDCDGDGETSDTDPDDADPCEGGTLSGVDLTDTTSDWYTADCDGDGVTNGDEVDPDGNGTNDANGTDPNDPCDFNAADVTIAQSGDWLTADCDGDGVTNGTEVTDMTDETDPCDFVAGSITLPVTAVTDCDGDGETSATDPDDADPCEGGTLSGVDLSDTTSDWYTADCDGDGVINGDEVDPDGNGTNDANGTDPTDPCDFNAVDVTVAQSGDWLTADCDGDGVTNGTEVTDTTDETDPCDFLAGSITLPVTAVTDCDGDGETSDTDPDDADPCEGGTLSGVDLTDTTSDWYTADCDGDGVTNGDEVDPDGNGTNDANGTDPNDPCDFNAADVTIAQSGDWLTADCDGDGVTNGTEVTDMTDESDPCDFLAGSITLPVTAITDCDGDGEDSTTDPDDADPCEGGTLSGVDLTDTTSDWYTTDCDGDGVTNGNEVDPDMDGTSGPNNTNPNDPCDFNPADVTVAQSGDWLTADCDGDGVTNGTEVTDTTDETDPCDFLAGSITLPVTAVTDCDGDGETSDTDPDDADPCEGGTLSGVDLTDTTSDWYTADCDGDGVTNGNEVDPDMDGTSGPNNTDPNDPCDFNAADVTIAQSGDWLTADCDGDGVTNGTEVTDMTDETDPCDFVAGSITLPVTAVTDCDGDGETSDTDPDDADPCEGGTLSGVDLTDTTSDWYTTDCDGDGVTNGNEVDPDMDGTSGPNNTNPNDPCDFNPADVTVAQSGDWLTADCDGDGVTNGTEVTDMTDETDPCDFLSGSITLPVTAVTDCDGDGETSATDSNDADPCEGGSLANVDLSDTTSDWYIADCDGDGVINGDEVDPDGNGANDANGTDPNDPCDFNAADVTIAQSGDWLTADCDGDGVTNGTEVNDTTDETDPCDFLAGSITLPVTAITDCDGDGETSDTDPDDTDPCEGGTLSGVDLTDTTSDWYTADCDGDGVINGDEVDPDGNGVNDANGTDPNDPCDFNAADVTIAQSGDWLAADCDGDGVTNGTEVTDMTDETDPCDFLAGSITLPVTAVTDCDGDGETSATDPDDTDPCEGGTLSGVDLSDTTSDWYTADCDGDGVTNGNEVDPDGNGTNDANGTDPNDPCDFNPADVTIAQSGDWLTADCDGDGVTNGTEVTDMTDETDPCDFLAGSITLPVTAVTDCDGDGETSDTDPDDMDPCEGGDLANVDLSDTSSDWYTADCDGDGVINGTEVDPNMDGTAGPDDTDPYDPCDFNAADVTIAQSGDWLTADCDGDGVTNGTEVTDMTDETDPCDFEPTSITLPVTAVTDCDGDGETSDTDPNDMDPCEGGDLANVDLSDTSSDWYNADCDGDGVINGTEVDPNMDGTAGPDDTDPNDPCDFNAADVTIAQSGDWLTADCDGDGVTNGDEVNDGTDETDPCDFEPTSITLPVTAVTDCDGDGETSDTDSNDMDPCEGGDLANVDLSDTSSDWYNADCDGDGVLNGAEVDPNMDGMAGPDDTDPNDPCDFNTLDVTIAQSGDWLTADCDGDGVTNGTEVADGTDETDPCDFEPSSITLAVTAVTDCDGDGILNADEIGDDPTNPVDTDGDMIPDFLDIDDDNDGIITLNEDLGDMDGDGLPDYLDQDSDDDGIPDNVEAQPTDNYIPPAGTDTDGDGLDDAYDDLSNEGLDTEDTDNDGDPDYIDEDSDNDSVPDATEAFDFDNDGEADILPSGNDLNNNGIDDNFEEGGVIGYEDPNGILNAGAIDTVNSDADAMNPNIPDSEVDFRDIDDDGDGIPTGEDEINDDCDNDGIPDYLDTDPCDMIPDAFTPNGDGENDTFVIPLVSNSPFFEIEVYNRYGNIVYEYSNRGRTGDDIEWWDAFSNGRWTLNEGSEKVPVGTYFYVITFNDNVREPVQGWVYVAY